MEWRVLCVGLSIALLACGPGLPDYSPDSNVAPGGQKHERAAEDPEDPNGNDPGGSPDDSDSDALDPVDECDADDDGLYGDPPLVISELAWGEGGFVEIRATEDGVDLSDMVLDGSFLMSLESEAPLELHEQLLIPTSALPAQGELALFRGNEMIRYVCWGAALGPLHVSAQLSGLWHSPHLCATPPAAGNSLHLQGSGTFAADFVGGTPTPLGCVE